MLAVNLEDETSFTSIPSMEDQTDNNQATLDYSNLSEANKELSDFTLNFNEFTELADNKGECEACSGDASSPTSECKRSEDQKSHVSGRGDYFHSAKSSGSESSIKHHFEVLTVQAEVHKRPVSPTKKLCQFFPFSNPKPGSSTDPDNMDLYVYSSPFFPEDNIEILSETQESPPSVCEKELIRHISPNPGTLYPIKKPRKAKNRKKLIKLSFCIIMLIILILMIISLLWMFLRTKIFSSSIVKHVVTVDNVGSPINVEDNNNVPDQKNSTTLKLNSIWGLLNSTLSAIEVTQTHTTYKYNRIGLENYNYEYMKLDTNRDKLQQKEVDEERKAKDHVIGMYRTENNNNMEYESEE